MSYIEEDYNRKHPKFFTALFGAFFKMFGWISLKRIFNNKLLRKTLYDNKIPTDAHLDADIETLGFYMGYVWPLINKIIREKTIYFFRYKFKRLLLKLMMFLIFLCLIIGIYVLYNRYIQKPKVLFIEKKKEIRNGLIVNTDTIFIPAERSQLTKDNLDYFASEMDIKYWYNVRKQIIIESGFSSDLLRDGNNLFGMKYPGQRETTAIGEIYGHAKYSHWVYSLYDYKIWQELKLKLNPLKKGESYGQWLKRINYAESDTYIQSLNSADWYTFQTK